MSSARSAPGVRTFLTGRANMRTGHPGTPPTWWRSRPGVICRRNHFALTPGCLWCGGRAAHAQSRSIGLVVVTPFVADDVQLPQLHRRAAAGRPPARVHHHPAPVADIRLFKYDDLRLWVTDGKAKLAAPPWPSAAAEMPASTCSTPRQASQLAPQKQSTESADTR